MDSPLDHPDLGYDLQLAFGWTLAGMLAPFAYLVIFAPKLYVKNQPVEHPSVALLLDAADMLFSLFLYPLLSYLAISSTLQICTSVAG